MVDVKTNLATRPDSGSVPRWINLLLGVWLFISAFAWPHTMAEMTDAWVVGLLIVAASVIAMYWPTARYANTVLAIWLFFSSLGFPHQHTATIWNHVIVAIIVFVLSLVPSRASNLTAGGGRRPIAAM
jgi:hypothetical protein